MTAEDVVLVEVADGIATLTLNRPDRKNSWSDELERGYFDALDRADDDPTVRAIVVTGAGTSFCPGQDMAWLSDASTQAGREQPAWRNRPMTHAMSIRKPVIAAINGGCAGVGLVQALACDVRFAATEARIAPAFTRLGLPAEFGGSWLLARLVGHGRALELLMSSRTISAAEAREIGLVHRVHPRAELLPAVLDYARDLVEHCSPVAMSAVKAQLAADWHRTIADSSDEAVRLVKDPDRRIDFAEGVAAYVERRPPRFRPLLSKGDPT